jgi:curved DNA-binding protein CbpA
VSERPFVDYYEILQLNQNADAETIERVYRMLAKRYHPDNLVTGTADGFSSLHTAYETLASPEARAQYDVRYDEKRALRWKIFDQESAMEGPEHDRRLFHGILSLLYVARRQDPIRGGIGPMFLEKTLGVPHQHLAFPLWYLKQHGWIEVLDNGQLAITVEGIDKLGNRDLDLPQDRLLPESSSVGPAERRRSVEEASKTDAEAGGRLINAPTTVA